MTRPLAILLLFVLPPLAARAQSPATQPADPTLDWLLEQAATAPAAATQPISRPASPFLADRDDGRRHGTLQTSDGEKIRGRFSTTRDKPIRVWDADDKEYRDIPFDLIQSFEARILWERDQPEWHFKESGSDIKEYTGKTYPARELEYTLTLVNGQQLTGGIVAPIYLQSPAGDKLFILHKRQKGDVGQPLKRLIYVHRLDLTDPAPTTRP